MTPKTKTKKECVRQQNGKKKEIFKHLSTLLSREGGRMNWTDHDEGVGDCGEDVELALEDEREEGEDAPEEVDGHEGERDAEDGAVLVDLVVLGSPGSVRER
jgi:hypothetical protein